MHRVRVLSHERSAPLMGAPGEAARALLEYGEELAAAGAAQTGGAFTDIPGADALIKSSPEAFVLGVLFTQGIPAERAWAGPFLLRQRLGHLDLVRLAAEEGEVAAAVAGPPALHRFIHTLPGWISSAARRILGEYGGHAERIWAEGSSVEDVTKRLLAFDGIGEKKAVMATEILMRHFGVELSGVESGSVAYDVHVRRVFLRTGMTDEDTPAAIGQAARLAAPHAPGTLDLAAWLVGRDWCHPRDPRCEECRLGRVCPRLTDRSVEGVGARRSR